jgi:hypothetical protein
MARKTRVLDVAYNASNNELVRAIAAPAARRLAGSLPSAF